MKDFDVDKIRGLLEKARDTYDPYNVIKVHPKYFEEALSLLPPLGETFNDERDEMGVRFENSKPACQAPEKLFNCKHFRGYSQSVPMPFAPGNCSEPLGDCAIESESEDCCLKCPDYEEVACQAPAGGIEELLREWRLLIHHIKATDPTSSEENLVKELEQACTYLTQFAEFMRYIANDCLQAHQKHLKDKINQKLQALKEIKALQKEKPNADK